MDKRRVLLTGASGYVASQLRNAFRDRFDLRMTDVQARDRDGAEVAGIEIADLVDADRSTYAHLFEGVDTTVASVSGRCGRPSKTPVCAPASTGWYFDNDMPIMVAGAYLFTTAERAPPSQAEAGLHPEPRGQPKPPARPDPDPGRSGRRHGPDGAQDLRRRGNHGRRSLLREHVRRLHAVPPVSHRGARLPWPQARRGAERVPLRLGTCHRPGVHRNRFIRARTGDSLRFTSN